MKWLIGLLIISILLIGIVAYLYPKAVKRQSLVDVCFYFYPVNCGLDDCTKTYKAGTWPGVVDDETPKTWTIEAPEGVIKTIQVAVRKLSPNDPEMKYKIRVCNSVGVCVEDENYLYPPYPDEYYSCYEECSRYGTDRQCEYATYVPIGYNCANICLYRGTFPIKIYMDRVGKDRKYTITILDVKKNVNGVWVDGGYIPDMVYAYWWDPTETPSPQKPTGTLDLIFGGLLSLLGW